MPAGGRAACQESDGRISRNADHQCRLRLHRSRSKKEACGERQLAGGTEASVLWLAGGHGVSPTLIGGA